MAVAGGSLDQRRGLVATATARTVSVAAVGAAGVREVRRAATPGKQVVAVAVAGAGDRICLAVVCRADSGHTEPLLAVYAGPLDEAYVGGAS